MKNCVDVISIDDLLQPVSIEDVEGFNRFSKLFLTLWKVATTLSFPYFSLSFGTNSEPICPAAPTTSIRLIFYLLEYPLALAYLLVYLLE
jgi:hypothetical protein